MRMTYRELIELLARATPGPWSLASDDELKFFIYKKGSSPIRYVYRDISETVSNYDLRLMAQARELAEEVIELRRQVELFKSLVEKKDAIKECKAT